MRKLSSVLNWQGELEQKGLTLGLGILDDAIEIWSHGDLAPGIFVHPCFYPKMILPEEKRLPLATNLLLC
jgi:hypothetical protein